MGQWPQAGKKRCYILEIFGRFIIYFWELLSVAVIEKGSVS